MLSAARAVWQATQAIRNDAARPRPASQRPASPMFKLLTNEPLAGKTRLFITRLTNKSGLSICHRLSAWMDL